MGLGLTSQSTVWRKVESFWFSDHRISRFLRPSACVPQPDTPPHRRFVTSKSQSDIRPSGDRVVEVPFLCFLSLQSSSNSPRMPVCCLTSAEGRNALAERRKTARGSNRHRSCH